MAVGHDGGTGSDYPCPCPRGNLCPRVYPLLYDGQGVLPMPVTRGHARLPIQRSVQGYSCTVVPSKWAKLPSLGKKHQSRSRSVVIFGRRVATSTKVEAFCGADCIRLRAVAHSHGFAAPSPAAWTTICASGKAEILLKTHLTSLN
uniref:Uncharacterized protein n=1 Tax=Oryza rufipogon TaxID=4529 RepID=A0A0E0RGN3_ORYRU